MALERVALGDAAPGARAENDCHRGSDGCDAAAESEASRNYVRGAGRCALASAGDGGCLDGDAFEQPAFDRRWPRRSQGGHEREKLVQALTLWLQTYNHRRQHTAALGGATPIDRVNNLPGQYS